MVNSREIGLFSATETRGYINIETAPPFVNELLQTYPWVAIPRKGFDLIVQSVQKPDVQDRLALDLLNRQVDLTGMVSELIGRCFTRDEVEKELIRLGKDELQRLKQKEGALQREVLAALEGGSCTARALLYLDKSHAQMTHLLKYEFGEGRKAEAEEFRANNLARLYYTDGVVRRQGYAINYIGGYAHFDGGRLIGVQRQVRLPVLPEGNLELLERLTPEVFRRSRQPKDQDPSTPIGLMLQLRKAGDPFARSVSEMLLRIDHILRDPSQPPRKQQEAIDEYFGELKQENEQVLVHPPED